MKIGFDAKRAFHNFRGLGNYSRTLLEGLLTYAPDHQYHLFTPSFKSEVSKNWLKSVESSIYLHKPDKLVSNFFSSYWRTFEVSKLVHQLNLDVFHGLSHELPLGLGNNVKKVVTIHDLIFLRYPKFYSWIDRQTYKAKILHATKGADVVVAICEQTKSDLIDFMSVPKEKIVVLYQSCSPFFYSENSDKNIHSKPHPRPFLLSVGSIEPRKNQLNLIKAFDLIKSDNDLDLLLVGRGHGKYYDEVLEFIKVNGLSDRVHLKSGVSNQELPSYYKQAMMLVYPSLFEGFGIPVVEALFSGTPVITSTGSCFVESGGDAAIYVDPYNVEQLSDKIQTLALNSSMKTEMSLRGMAHAQKFHIAQTTTKLLNMYNSL